MLVIHCNECQDRLTEEQYDSYHDAETARHRVGYATGRITRYGEDEVLCRKCYQVDRRSKRWRQWPRFFPRHTG